MLALLAVISGCKKKALDIEDGTERGRLRRISARLEEAYGTKSLPGLSEPEKLADRLAKWDDFRSCTVRTYVARKREADRLAREGIKRPSRHGSIGDVAIEECAVQSAVVNKDPSMCQRLALDYQGPNGEMPLAAVRCWDTRARVFGRPEECPVVWMPDDLPGRNPECLAMAARDPSYCAFADDPPRCRALLSGERASCQGAAPDCPLAVAYWGGLIPAGEAPATPAIDLGTTESGAPARAKGADGVKPTPVERAVYATVDVRWPLSNPPTIRIDAPLPVLGISWPGGKVRQAYTEDTTPYWGTKLPLEAAQLTWRTGQPAVKIAFSPGGAASGARPVKPPGPLAPATVLLVWPDPRDFKRCQPDERTTGQVEFDAAVPRPGGFVRGTIDARDLACSDGRTVSVQGKFRMVILDVR